MDLPFLCREPISCHYLIIWAHGNGYISYKEDFLFFHTYGHILTACLAPAVVSSIFFYLATAGAINPFISLLFPLEHH